MPPGPHDLERDRHQLPGRREHDRPIARPGRQLGGVSDPRRAQLARELAVPLATREHDELATPVPEHLHREVRRRAEAHERDALAGLHLGAPQRAR